ncbi:MAG: hypothetical protein WCK69_00810 [Candidatus Saccharibacteria bacterium]
MNEIYMPKQDAESAEAKRITDARLVGRAIICYAGTESESDLPDIIVEPSEYWANMPS